MEDTLSLCDKVDGKTVLPTVRKNVLRNIVVFITSPTSRNVNVVLGERSQSIDLGTIIATGYNDNMDKKTVDFIVEKLQLKPDAVENFQDLKQFVGHLELKPDLIKELTQPRGFVLGGNERMKSLTNDGHFRGEGHVDWPQTDDSDTWQ